MERDVDVGRVWWSALAVLGITLAGGGVNRPRSTSSE